MANSLGDTTASFVESGPATGAPAGAAYVNPLFGYWSSPNAPTPGAIGASIPAITGGVVPNPIDPASGLPVIPGVSTVPGATTLPSTPGGGTVIPGVTGPTAPPQTVVVTQPAGFWDRYGATVSAALAVVGALALGKLAYDKVRGY